jgi:hypothetical protein
MPFGPRELLTLSATILAASMFVCRASRPLDRFEPSFKTRTGTPPADCVDKPYTSLLLRHNENQPHNISISKRAMEKFDFKYRIMENIRD